MLQPQALVDARLEPRQDDRRHVEQALPLASRLVSWWKRQIAVSLEDSLVDSRSERMPVRMVAPVLAPILIIPGIVVLREPENTFAVFCLITGIASVVYAAASERVERRVLHVFRVQLVNTAFYAAMISLVLATFILFDHPRDHLHWVIFFLYFLLIGAVGLSDDPRQAAAAGGLSIVGYGCVVLLAHHAGGSGNVMAARLLPEFEWVANGAKIAMLAAASFVAVASARRGRMLRRLSMRDPLTGLLNRRAFDECLRHLAERAARGKTDLTVAMIDIDHFKELNDAHGHATGDVVLRWVAARIDRSFRESDLVARYGGEEFVVALIDATDARVLERLEVLRAHIATSVLREQRDEDAPSSDPAPEIRTSVSMGVAQLPADGATPLEALARADARLYEAKTAGRNRISH